MTNETQFRKEAKDRKKDYQEKKIELISRLCNETTSIEKKNDKEENKK